MADRTAHFSNWFQIISNVAIIFGLGLVVYELNQSKQIALAQMAESYASRTSARQVASMGDSPQKALAKAAFHPVDLNEEDAVTLDAYDMQISTNWIVAHGTSQIVGTDRGWREAVQLEVSLYFSSDPGHRWLKLWAAGLPDSFGADEVAKLALEAAESGSGNSLRSRYDRLLAND